MMGNLSYKVDYDKKEARVLDVDVPSAIIEVPAEIDGCSVIAVMQDAFRDKSGIDKVILPNTIQYIGAHAFMNCSLKTLKVKNNTMGNNTPLNIYSAAFKNCANLEKVSLKYPTEFRDWSVFENCSNLHDVSSFCIQGNIPRNTFKNCYNLKLFSVHHSMNIEQEAFHNVKLNCFSDLGVGILKFDDDFLKVIEKADISCQKDTKIANLAYQGYKVFIFDNC